MDAGETLGRSIDPTPTGQRPLGPCYGLDTSNLNGVASGVDGYRKCTLNYGVGNAAVAPLRRNSGDVASPRRLRRHRVVYYHPFKDYVGVDAFEYSVSVAGAATESTGVVGVHVRNCRPNTYNKRVQPVYVPSPLCACDANETWAFGSDECPAAISTVCSADAGAASFPSLCDACDRGADVATTKCRRAIDRAATTVVAAGLCGDVAPADCRAESVSTNAPFENYVWWDRTLMTPEPQALAPPGSRAGNTGDGGRVFRV